ncbi:MAG: cytochrome c class [Gammaproteobacteria bacterium]|nr:cytochrome c class [Gammaproteobacteria bacterium]
MRGLIAIVAVAALGGCGGGTDRARLAEARTLIASDCAACHQVPGVSSAKGRVGPSLAGIAHQQIIAGHFANTPETLVNWIEHPQHMLPGNAMPEMGLSHEQARTIATYLYTLEDR